jgi:LytS/YehU family sensor histidine kinase
LSDKEFPVENCMIVGTDLKQVERITGRLTTGKVALGGALSGLWLGIFVGIVFALFDTKSSGFATIVTTALFGVVFGVVWGLVGYAATRGQRDFSSVRVVVATRYEVLVEHKLLARAQQLLAELPGARPNPFA